MLVLAQATTLTPKSASIKDEKMPSIFWHPVANQWVAKIGYWLFPTKGEQTSPGRRDRAYQYVGKNESLIGKHEAETKAIQIKRDWDKLTSDWSSFHQPGLERHLPEYDWSKPVWLDHKFVMKLLAKVKAKAEESEKLVEDTKAKMEKWDQKRVEDVAKRNPQVIQKLLSPLGTLKSDERSITIAEAKVRYLSFLLNRTTLKKGKSIKANSYNNVKTALQIALKPIPVEKIMEKNETMTETDAKRLASLMPIDTNKRLVQITKKDLESFVNFWWSEWNGLKPRTAKNYCKELKKLLDWCAEQEEPEYATFLMPKGAMKVFSFKNADPVNIKRYEPKNLVLLRENSTDRTYLYYLLGFAGMYQGDIAHLRFDEIAKLVDGEAEPVPLSYEELKAYDGSYDIYLYRRRDRTDHKVDERQRSLIWLFPETGRLLARFAAPKDNKFGFVLLNEDGRPLVTTATEECRTDNIRSAMMRALTCAKDKIVEKALGDGKTQDEAETEAKKFGMTMKQFRKIGSTFVGNNSKDDSTTVVRLYRSQPPEGDAKFYLADDYERKLTPVMKLWATQLRADNVLVNLPSTSKCP